MDGRTLYRYQSTRSLPINNHRQIKYLYPDHESVQNLVWDFDPTPSLPKKIHRDKCVIALLPNYSQLFQNDLYRH